MAASIPPSNFTCYLFEPGSHLFCLEKLENRLAQRGISHIIRVNGESLAKALQEKQGLLNRCAIFIPGGKAFSQIYALFKHMKAVQDAIRQGCGYFGSCSGGLIACRNFTLLTPETQEDFDADCLLNLLPVKAEAPLFDAAICHADNYPGRMVSIRKGDAIFPVYWNAGGGYKALEVDQVEIVATYQEKPEHAFAAKGKCGKGAVAILGGHPEIRKAHLSEEESDEKQAHADYQSVHKELESSPENILACDSLLDELFDFLGLPKGADDAE